MNIVPSYPNMVPLALQPAVQAAQGDTRQRELIPAARQGEASAKESQAGSEKDKARSNESRPVTYQADGTLRGGSAQTDVVPAVDDQSQGKSSGQNQSQADDRDAKGQTSSSDTSGSNPTDAQQQSEQTAIDALEARDQEVRNHEQAHQAAGGQYASAPSYSTQRGPDGQSYAIGGEVQIDISAESEPAATIRKMQQVRSAALAPAEPSSQDRSVAAKASQLEAKARAELQSQQAVTSNATASTSASREGEQDRGASEPDDSSKSQAQSVEPKSATMSRRGHVIANRYQLAWQPQGESLVSRYA